MGTWRIKLAVGALSALTIRKPELESKNPISQADLE